MKISKLFKIKKCKKKGEKRKMKIEKIKEITKKLEELEPDDVSFIYEMREKNRMIRVKPEQFQVSLIKVNNDVEVIISEEIKEKE